ncbi:hypothetical protein M752DRAFT_58966 [Aspergillus phoenicis ATCC 13157]|uniref:Uncharacterized protein n=1 Tax=Aspergillus phoenicis ATCC 13157 TaxID=1353007 RepID=A0A370PA33_ASPPH|nr:hypothetical protein M752DRAFT_58966 [Aspergillus phoenicis ATCC 13157]
MHAAGYYFATKYAVCCLRCLTPELPWFLATNDPCSLGRVSLELGNGLCVCVCVWMAESMI